MMLLTDFDLEDFGNKYMRHKYQAKMWSQQFYVLTSLNSNKSNSSGLEVVI